MDCEDCRYYSHCTGHCLRSKGCVYLMMEEEQPGELYPDISLDTIQ